MPTQHQFTRPSNASRTPLPEHLCHRSVPSVSIFVHGVGKTPVAVFTFSIIFICNYSLHAVPFCISFRLGWGWGAASCCQLRPVCPSPEAKLSRFRPSLGTEGLSAPQPGSNFPKTPDSLGIIAALSDGHQAAVLAPFGKGCKNR